MCEAGTDARVLRAFADDSDTVAAYDLEDVRRYYVDDEKTIGADEFRPDDWSELKGGETLSIVFSEDDWRDLKSKPEGAAAAPSESIEGHLVITAAVAAWVASHGRGLICSTEW